MGLDVTATYNRASDLCLTTRITSANNIKGSAGKLFWLLVSNANASMRHFSLHNATSGTTGLVHKFYMKAEDTHLFNFDPPIPFDTGIRIGEIEHADITMVGGYV